jgi:geranylgeranyl diphosphate synthase type I
VSCFISQEVFVDIYEMIQAAVTAVPHLKSWPDIQTIFHRHAVCQPKGWLLPLTACQAVGGTLAQAVPAMAALACLQISIILVDDLLDEDPKGVQHRIGVAAAANTAVAFQAAAFTIITHSGYTPNIQTAITTCLNEMVLTTAFGQYLDTLSLVDEAAYWQQVDLKSAPFFGAALQIGGLAGGATAETVQHLRQVGLGYGKIVQIHDDLKDALAQPANPDWLLERAPLPILFAQTVDHPERQHFQQLRQRIADPAALAEAQGILIRCGAVSYCIDQIMRGHAAGQQLIAEMQLVDSSELMALIDGLATPVQDLFTAVITPTETISALI